MLCRKNKALLGLFAVLCCACHSNHCTHFIDLQGGVQALGWPTDVVEVQTVVLDEMPPFLEGEPPFQFQVGRSADGQVLFHRFETFQNSFIFNDQQTIVGAITSDCMGHVIGKASARYYIKSKEGDPQVLEQGIALEETHANEDGTIFECSSSIDAQTGFKIKETMKKGAKQQHYYALWPTLPPPMARNN